MPPDGILIRLLNPADAQRYLKLRLHALQAAPLASSSSYNEEKDTSVEAIRARLERQAQTGCAFVGAFDDGQLVGMVCLHRERREKNRHKAMMWGLYVCEDYRRRGIARAMIQKVIAICEASSSLTQLRTTIATDIPAGQELYRSIGFNTFGLEEDAIRLEGRSYDVEYMMLRLKRRGGDAASAEPHRV